MLKENVGLHLHVQLLLNSGWMCLGVTIPAPSGAQHTCHGRFRPISVFWCWCPRNSPIDSAQYAAPSFSHQNQRPALKSLWAWCGALGKGGKCANTLFCGFNFSSSSQLSVTTTWCYFPWKLLIGGLRFMKNKNRQQVGQEMGWVQN